ncbi:MAG: serine/threonine protein kinase, partial [Myxococcales bacterium]|nr:serine/threonine protein kinase [Myxococcales bacterium]
MELTEGAIIAERFRLTRMLGKGGMGEVWAAQHMSLDIPCAVKFIHAESAQKPEVRERFEREAKAAAQLRSPNVVQILDYGVCDTTPYIAMEYLQGEELAQRLRAVERLDPRQTFAIAVGVGKALSKAHRAGIVHRDLKPEN